jgi:hypothetical protein
MNLITPGTSGLRDAWAEAWDQAKQLKSDTLGMVGYGLAELFDEEMNHKLIVPFSNLITDAGDLYYATAAITGISPANGTGNATKVNGMKLGTATTAVGKTSTGAASLAASSDYITGSNVVFDSTYPQVSNLGAGLGVNAVFKTTWAAGTPSGTNTINSVVIVNDQATNATTTTANTISRAVISAVTKTAADTLAITWNHKFLGA